MEVPFHLGESPPSARPAQLPLSLVLPVPFPPKAAVRAGAGEGGERGKEREKGKWQLVPVMEMELAGSHCSVGSEGPGRIRSSY